MSRLLVRRVLALLCVFVFAAALPPAFADDPPEQGGAPASRPRALAPLYVSFATLQALDVHSTLRALDGGSAREANPILGAAAGSPAAMIALKAGAGAGLIYASERLWKRNRVAAVAMMVAVNSAYAIVVAHNYAVAGRPNP